MLDIFKEFNPKIDIERLEGEYTVENTITYKVINIMYEDDLAYMDLEITNTKQHSDKYDTTYTWKGDMQIITKIDNIRPLTDRREVEFHKKNIISYNMNPKMIITDQKYLDELIANINIKYYLTFILHY